LTIELDALGDVEDNAWPVLAHLARCLHVKNAELQPTLDAIVAHAVSTIEPAGQAGLILLVGGRLTPQATLGSAPHALDEFQRQSGSGPCIAAAREQSVIRLDSTVTDGRWPDFAERALALGVASMLCVPLWVDQQKLGTLSMYADKPEAFTTQHIQVTDLYATHAALALAEAQRAAQLRAAARTRDVIGQAKGILIERMKITPDRAFECLSLASQNNNLKLVAVAEHLVATGELLGQ
jgi:GAF domain-containing protein